MPRPLPTGWAVIAAIPYGDDMPRTLITPNRDREWSERAGALLRRIPPLWDRVDALQFEGATQITLRRGNHCAAFVITDGDNLEALDAEIQAVRRAFAREGVHLRGH